MEQFNPTTLSIINLIGFAVNAFLYWRRGTSQATHDLLELQEKQIETLKGDADISRQRSHDLANQMQDLVLKVGNLQGKVQEKDKKITDYVTILQNRNPELTEFIQRMTTVAEAAMTYMQRNEHEVKEIKALVAKRTRGVGR